EHQIDGTATGFRAFGGYTVRNRDTELQSAPFVIIERLRDGPAPNLLDPGPGSDHVWELGGRVHSTIAREGYGEHTIVAGGGLSSNSTTRQSAFTGLVGEEVDGLPARIWSFIDPPAISSWHSTTLDAYVSDTVAVSSRVTVNGGATFELVHGF